MPKSVAEVCDRAQQLRSLHTDRQHEKGCAVEGCDRKHYGHGWCQMHWGYNRRHGSPHRRAVPIVRDPSERFWPKVKKSDGCWEWTAKKSASGYGRFYSGKKDGEVQAHRWAYEQKYGPVPEGLVMDHLCRNRGCVNPDHLEPVTHRTNLLRGVGVSAVHAVKTHCYRGHPFDEKNTYRHSRGRACRACRRIADRKRCR